ncbi:MAG: DUF2786 domain-containing protein, partial [Planctomycetota bacterium]|nr:DUF2786 domain-containing protein [Planctomycetota bacterium]
MAEKTRRADSPASLQQFPEALERAWLKRLAWHFDHVNYQYLGCALKRPLFILGDSKKKLGSWDGNRRTLMISRHHILCHDWETVVDTLRHEMAHQYVQEHLGLGAAAPHGREFRDACELLRCDPAAKADGAAMGKLEDSPAEKDRKLGRIKELLALAGSPNEHEAATAMRLAQKYLLKYNLDFDDLPGERSYDFLYLGD